jgi:hypothetical protein
VFLNLYVIVPLAIILVAIISYLNSRSKKQRRIEEAAARSEANRLAREERLKKAPVQVPVIKNPPLPNRIVKKAPDLTSRQHDIINKIIDDSTFDHIESIEMWGNTEPGELSKSKDRNVK